MNRYLFVLICILFFVTNSFAVDKSTEKKWMKCNLPCHGYDGTGGPCYDGPNRPLYDGPGGACYSGPGGPCYIGPGGTGEDCSIACE